MLRKIITVNGDTLVIPELKSYLGRKMEIIVNEIPKEKKAHKNLREYFGKLKTNVDGLEFQKRMRAEWEEREKSF